MQISYNIYEHTLHMYSNLFRHIIYIYAFSKCRTVHHCVHTTVYQLRRKTQSMPLCTNECSRRSYEMLAIAPDPCHPRYHAWNANVTMMEELRRTPNTPDGGVEQRFGIICFYFLMYSCNIYTKCQYSLIFLTWVDRSRLILSWANVGTVANRSWLRAVKCYPPAGHPDASYV